MNLIEIINSIHYQKREITINIAKYNINIAIDDSHVKEFIDEFDKLIAKYTEDIICDETMKNIDLQISYFPTNKFKIGDIWKMTNYSDRFLLVIEFAKSKLCGNGIYCIVIDSKDIEFLLKEDISNFSDRGSYIDLIKDRFFGDLIYLEYNVYSNILMFSGKEEPIEKTEINISEFVIFVLHDFVYPKLRSHLDHMNRRLK